MQSLSAFALLLEIVPVLAGVSPFARRSDSREREWTPARETPAPSGTAEGGLSPAPTARPHGDFGEVELFKRYQMGSDTCGFASGYKSEPWTCYKLGASCVTTGAFLGCCAGTTPDCYSTVLTTCVDFVQGQPATTCPQGSLCCGSQYPSCWTWQFSSSTAPSVTLTAYNCYATGGTGTLLDFPPIMTVTTATDGSSLSDSVTRNLNPGTTSRSSSTTSSSSTTPTTSAAAAGSGESSVPVGPIVGGVIGGLAVIGTAIVLIFWLVTRQRRQAAVGPGSEKPPAGAGIYPPSAVGSPNPDGSPQNYYGAAAAGAYRQYPTPPPQPGAPSPYGAYAGYYDPSKPTPPPQQYSPSVPVQPHYTGHSEGAWSGGQPSPAPGPPVSELGAYQPARAELG